MSRRIWYDAEFDPRNPIVIEEDGVYRTAYRVDIQGPSSVVYEPEAAPGRRRVFVETFAALETLIYITESDTPTKITYSSQAG